MTGADGIVAAIVDELIVEDGEQPDAERASGLIAVGLGIGGRQRFLDQILGILAVARQSARVAQQRRQQIDHPGGMRTHMPFTGDARI